MAFGNFSNDGGGQPMAEINTTPLVDVMLVLLVIFIITAPLFRQAVPVDLPKVDATRLDEKPDVIRLGLDAGGRIFWNDEVVARQDLPARLAAAGARQPELQLRADRAVRYERVAEVMAAAQAAGLTRIAFVTEPAR